MAIKYLYIDDETPAKSSGIVKPLINDALDFAIERPKSWNDQKIQLIESGALNDYDGLLLDLKLEFSEGEENVVKFNGADLAQTIRTDVKAGKVDDLPIFLCSTDDKYMALFDRTSYDLFDKKYRKDVDFVSGEARSEFIAFAGAYKTVKENADVARLLQKEVSGNDDLIALSAALAGCRTPHEKVYLIDRFVIQANGILLDEPLLAIRLGIDIDKSAGWQSLKETVLRTFEYSGILSGCYQRWWQADLLRWWRETIGKSLRVMSAKERVDALLQKVGASDLVSIDLPTHHRFDTFWYKCSLSNTPLEPSDGLRTIEMPRYVWQEPSYISTAYMMSEERDRHQIMSLLGANEQMIFEELTPAE